MDEAVPALGNLPDDLLHELDAVLVGAQSTARLALGQVSRRMRPVFRFYAELEDKGPLRIASDEPWCYRYKCREQASSFVRASFVQHDLDTLKWAHRHGADLSDPALLSAACAAGPCTELVTWVCPPPIIAPSRCSDQLIHDAMVKHRDSNMAKALLSGGLTCERGMGLFAPYYLAVELDDDDMLRWLFTEYSKRLKPEKQPGQFQHEEFVKHASHRGSRKCAAWLINGRLEISISRERTIQKCAHAAVDVNNLDFLDWFTITFEDDVNAGMLYWWILSRALKHGKLDVLKWMCNEYDEPFMDESLQMLRDSKFPEMSLAHVLKRTAPHVNAWIKSRGIVFGSEDVQKAILSHNIGYLSTMHFVHADTWKTEIVPKLAWHELQHQLAWTDLHEGEFARWLSAHDLPPTPPRTR